MENKAMHGTLVLVLTHCNHFNGIQFSFLLLLLLQLLLSLLFVAGPLSQSAFDKRAEIGNKF